ncbi:MAG TPA: SgcJ/EcaC family oxidoreductase [Sphingobium sp.]
MNSPATSDERILESLPKIFCEAVNSKDAYRLAEIMADDVDYVNVAAALLHGRADVEKHHVAGFAGVMSASIFALLQVSIRFLRLDIAVVHWSWTASGDKNRDGTEKPRRYGIMTMIAEKKGDGWKVVVVQNTNSIPGFGPEAGIISPMPLPDHMAAYN